MAIAMAYNNIISLARCLQVRDITLIFRERFAYILYHTVKIMSMSLNDLTKIY